MEMKVNKLRVSKTMKNDLITYAMVILTYIVVQILVSTGHVSSLVQGLLVPFCTYVIVAVALNLTVGILGELSLGHAGFMCVGAFASAVFSLAFKEVLPGGIRFLLALLIGAVMAALVGFLVGIPVLRLRGDYLAIVTLAFGEIIKNIINVLYLGVDSNGLHFSMKDALSLHMEEDGIMLIKGAQGVTGTPNDSNFTIGVVLILVTLFIVLNFIHSRTGRAVMSIRDNRIAAESVGINVTKYKLIAFTISASLAGVAGVLYAHNLSTLNALPKNFGYNMSIMILVFVVLGGIGNIRGSIIAAVLLTLLPEVLRGLSDYRMLIYSIVLIVMMIFNWSPNAVYLRKRLKQRISFSKKTEKEEA